MHFDVFCRLLLPFPPTYLLIALFCVLGPDPSWMNFPGSPSVNVPLDLVMGGARGRLEWEELKR